MRLDFVGNMKRNMIAAAVNKVVGFLFPFLNRTLFLWLLGPAYLGLNGLFGSILGILSLAEMGFGMAVISSMYKPVADDDQELICAYLRFYRIVYRCVGIAIFIAGLVLLPFLRRLVHGDVPPDVNLYILYLLHLLNTSASYFLFAYRGSVLSAYHRHDVLTHIRTLVSVAQYITVFLILLLTRNYYLYVIATVAFTVISNLLVVRESRRLFPSIEPRGELPRPLRQRVMKDVMAIFLHKVGEAVTYSSDNIVISMFLGLVAIAAYGNYYYVVTSIAGIPYIIYYSMIGGFGNKIHTESREENFSLFMRANRMVGMIIVWCSAMMMALYQPFIAIWTHEDPALLRHILTPILMVLYFYINQSRQVLLKFKAAAALWREDQLKPLIAGAVNLTLNILLVCFLPEEYRLDGVVFSTIFSFVLIQIPWESHVLFTVFFGRSEAGIYWRSQAKFAFLALVLCSVTWGAAYVLRIPGVFGFLVKGAAAAAVSGGMMLILFRRDFLSIVKTLCRRKS